jgi:hypothetical protein
MENASPIPASPGAAELRPLRCVVSLIRVRRDTQRLEYLCNTHHGSKSNAAFGYHMTSCLVLTVVLSLAWQNLDFE